MRRILEFLFFFSRTKPDNKLQAMENWTTYDAIHGRNQKERKRNLKTIGSKNCRFSYRRVFEKFFFLKTIRAHFVSNYIIRYTLWLYLFNHSLSSSHDRERVECNVSYLSQRKHVHVWLHARIIDCRATILRRHSSTYVRYTYRSTFCQRIHA